MCDSKKCARCEEVKPLTDFGSNKSEKDGLQRYCKPCKRASYSKKSTDRTWNRAGDTQGLLILIRQTSKKQGNRHARWAVFCVGCGKVHHEVDVSRRCTASRASKIGLPICCGDCGIRLNKERHADESQERADAILAAGEQVCHGASGCCGKVKPLSEFHASGKYRTGYTIVCKACARAKSKEYNAQPHIKQRSADRHKARWTDPVKRAEHLAQQARWRAQKENAYFNERAARRRATERDQTPEDVDVPLLKRIFADCPEGYHVDHIWPIVHGGLHQPQNLCYLPGPENLSKHARLPEGRILHQLLLENAILPALT